MAQSSLWEWYSKQMYPLTIFPSWHWFFLLIASLKLERSNNYNNNNCDDLSTTSCVPGITRDCMCRISIHSYSSPTTGELPVSIYSWRSRDPEEWVVFQGHTAVNRPGPSGLYICTPYVSLWAGHRGSRVLRVHADCAIKELAKLN